MMLEPGEKATVLVVDDTPDNLDVVKGTLAEPKTSTIDDPSPASITPGAEQADDITILAFQFKQAKGAGAGCYCQQLT